MNRFENVDVLAALEQLMRQNTAFYRNDFEIDKEIIGRATASDKAEDRTLLWMSPYFVQMASSKDTDRLFSMLPYKSLAFTGMKDRHGLYAVIGKDENRDKEVRRPRASIRRQLSETKQAQAPKKAPARTKKNELEV